MEKTNTKKNTEEKTKKGTLYIVGTPIGNLGDITLRAIETLKKVDVILAEDTRQTLKLLNHFEIEKHLVSYHRHNEDDKIKKMVEFLDNSKNLALVSDAGMPVISDPGSNLIKYLVENNYNVEVIPGVTAVITAIVKSGIDSTRFSFEGFLSINKKQRKLRLKELQTEVRTMVFYEAPHKILVTLKDMYENFGNRNICIARELTKIHEQYIYTTFEKAIVKIEESGIKGEIVLIVEGADKQKIQQEEQDAKIELDVIKLVKEEMENGTSKKDAVKLVAKLKGVNRNEVYQECIDI
ncbi:MAG: 16S rRNA (cytidine(1402)-2'-O)-methyltransferase [Clostridia bacterium]